MINYIFGSVEICVNNINSISRLVKNNIRCSEIRKNDNKLYFNIPLYSLKKTCKILNDESVEYRIIKIKGIPGFLNRFKTRYGLYLGVIVFFVLISISGKYIWSFRVTGNSYVSDKEIISLLTDLGCGIGTKIDTIEFAKLHNRFLIECPDIAWISVNMDGVIADVEIREVKRENPEGTGYANIVASEDGQIEMITIVNGKSQVEIGDVVRKGDLLISGVESYREGENTYYENAEGCVFARVNKEIKVQVNNQKKSNVRTGNYIERKSLKIFNLNINLFGNGGNHYDKYDIITENRQLVLFDTVVLPVWVNREKIYEVDDTIITLSKNEVEAEASKIYNILLRDATQDCELVSIVTSRNFENGVLTIESNLYCTTDIAERVAYDILPYDQKED